MKNYYNKLKYKRPKKQKTKKKSNKTCVSAN